MSKFFERGNLALDWDYIPDCVTAVAVTDDGSAFCFEVRPNSVDFGGWAGGGLHWILGNVGAPCPDWRELLFERPQAPRLPDGFWEACDMVYGETCKWATLDADSDTPYVYSAKPALRSDGVYTAYSGNVGAVSGVVITGVDYKDSLTRRPFLRIGQTEADE